MFTYSKPILPVVAGKTLTEDCKKELAEFKTDRGTNINKNVPLGKLCKSFLRPVYHVDFYMAYFPISLSPA